MNTASNTALLQQLWQNARALDAAGQLIEASQAYVTLLQHAPNNAAVLYNLGMVYQGLNRHEEALDAYRRAIMAKPDLAQAHNNMGNSLRVLGRTEDALTSYSKALELDAALAQARHNKAAMELALGRLTPAVASLRHAAQLDPRNDTIWSQLFGVLIGLKRKQEAIEAFNQWEANVPQSLSLASAGLIVSRMTGDEVRERRYLFEVEQWPFGDADAEQLTTLLGNLVYFDMDRQAHLACYRRLDRALQRARGEMVPLLPRRSPGRLRIGYVSADFRRHVMGRILFDVISAHDRESVDIYLISLCAERFHDDVTAQFRALANGFADVSQLDDRQAAQVIVEADIDVLVDLAAHTQGARPGLYSWQPARHIVTHLGYHGSIGLRQVEYKLTDRFVEAEDSARYQIEKPYFLDACFIPLSSVPMDAADSAEEQRKILREKWGFDGKFVFATFVSTVKLSPACLAVWREILQLSPNAVLAFSPFDDEDRVLIQRIAAKAGFNPSQVMFIDVAPSSSEAELRDRYLAVDAVLDTFPYAGGDTTLAALDRDVPVVTLSGRETPSRAGYSILSHLGLNETIAFDRAQFVEIAVRLSKDPILCGVLREKIRALRRKPSGLTIVSHARALERAFADISQIGRMPTGKQPARDFFRQFQGALREHQGISTAKDVAEKRAQIDKIYADLLAEQPDFAPLLYARGMLSQESGLAAEAIKLLGHAVEVAPDHDIARLALASLFAEANRMSEVVALLMPVAEATSNAGAVNQLLARALLDAGQYDAAESAAARVVRAAPSDPKATFMHGLALSHLGRSAEALAMFNRTLGLQGTHVEAAYNAAILMHEGGNSGTAEMLYRRVLEVDPRHEFAHWRLTALLLDRNRPEDFLLAAGSFAKACSDSLRARLRLAVSRRYAGDLADESKQLRLVADGLLSSENPAEVEEPLRALLELAAQIDFDTDLMRLLQQQSINATALLYAGSPGKPASRREGRIRLGYLVNDVPKRTGADPVREIFGRHDRSRFDVFVYLLTQIDGATPFAGDSVQVTNMAGWSVSRITGFIAGCDLDVIIDTTALIDEKAAAVLSQRVARTSLCAPWVCHHPVKPVDFRLAGTETELPKASALLPARPVMLARSIWPLPAASRQSDNRFSRQAMGVPEDRAVLAVLAPLERISLRCLSAWKAVVEANAHIFLLLVVPNRHSASAWLRVFQSAGFESSRLMMVDAEASGIRECDLSTIADVVLDTFPANDPGSVMDAIRSSLPVITLAGGMPVERTGLSLLATLGVKDTVVGSGAEYAEIAEKLAKDIAWREDLVARMKTAVASSPLTDYAGYMRDYEAALQQLLENAGQSVSAA
ncbi:MAG: tetratricopeptide repeat protein [Betaproteobacteria bacterium]|nr:tetratricopeptide repeat protein [Betaproteobacteria bacterium]